MFLAIEPGPDSRITAPGDKLNKLNTITQERKLRDQSKAALGSLEWAYKDRRYDLFVDI